MANQPEDKVMLPSLIMQNPAPFEKDSQGRKDVVRDQVDRIMEAFLQVLPSNYVSQISGPFYTIQLQAMAEQIAEFQITAQEVMADSVFDYTRSEVLFQIIGSLVFPDAAVTGYPDLEGDLTYRTFLQRMVQLLLQGATAATIKSGVGLLTEATVEIIEKGVLARKNPGSAWGSDDMFTFEVNINQLNSLGDSEFPTDPIALQNNVALVLRALKPAHTLYDYRHVFKETFTPVFSDVVSYNLTDYHYHDLRKYWQGAVQITGTAGETLTDRTLFNDPTRDFSSILPGAELTILTGPNSIQLTSTSEGYEGHFQISEVRYFPVGDDSIARAYTTSPTGLTGFVTVVGDMLVDLSQDWSLAEEGEILTLLTGPNAGSYRLKTVAGLYGGPVGKAVGPGTQVIVAPSMLRLRTRMKVAATGQSYTLVVDRAGVQAPRREIEDVGAFFHGVAPATNDTFFTQQGPLVKNWGDWTPAGLTDVVVEVGGVAVSVKEINPYTGKVVLTNPVVLSLVPDVTVTYYWFHKPVFEMGLNTEGLVLNKWERIPGNGVYTETLTPGSHGYQIQDSTHPKGAVGYPGFSMGVVLGGVGYKQEPLLIGHRYLGYEREYTALIGDPTSLRLNQSPHEPSAEAFERLPVGVSVAYDGTQGPNASVPPWTLLGTDSGAVDINAGTYTLVDSRVGSYIPLDPPIAYYYKDEDFSFPATVSVIGRFQIEDSASLLKSTNTNILHTDGVFTGVGFGFYDERYLYLVGALFINGVEHIGILKDTNKINLISGWNIGPEVTGTITDANTIAVPTATSPQDLRSGSRFQILSGTQIGIYTATSVIVQPTGVTTLAVTPAFPTTPINKFGNKYPQVFFETPWSGALSTYRMVVSTRQKQALLTVSGLSTATIVSVRGTSIPQPSQSSLALFTQPSGPKVFWGSLSYEACSRTKWSFLRYGVVPDDAYVRQHVKALNAEMSVLPENDGFYEWTTTQNFGYSKLERAGLLLKSTSAHTDLDFSFAYTRTEPLFVRDSNIDFRASFYVASGVLGCGDAQVLLNDGTREVRMGSLLFYEDAGQDPYRKLIDLPKITLSGIWTASNQGWTLVSGSTGTATCHESDLVVTQTSGHSLSYRKILSGMGSPYVETASLVADAYFAVDSYIGDILNTTGIGFNADVGAAFNVGVRLRGGVSPTVQLITLAGVVVQQYSFDWDDEEFHDYRLVISSGVVSLFLDDTIQVPTENLFNFPGGSGTYTCTFGSYTIPSSTTSVVRWRSVGFSGLPDSIAGVHRTLGIFSGSDTTDIDHWSIPRVDGTTALNSSGLALVEEMDWRNDSEIRLLRDPKWGVTLYRPDMPNPPTHTVPAEFVTEIADTKEGWVNVEYSRLPYRPVKFGYVTFGASDKRSFTQQHWSWVRCRLFKPDTDDYIAPQNMVLNWANTVSSGDRKLDSDLETVYIQTLDTRRVSLKPTNIYASSIYKIIDGSTIYTRESFTFDVYSQTITLSQDSAGNDLYFSGGHAAVTIMFIAGSPVTTTYLLTQPLLDSAILLNENTPVFQKNQLGDPIFSVGSAPTGPGDDKTYQVAVGTSGVLNSGLSTLADSVDMGEVLPGYEVRVLSGTGTGTYTVTGVAGHIVSIVPAPPINETGVVWEIWGGFSLGAPAGNLAVFTADPESLYASMQFFEVTNDGWSGLLSTPYDGEPWQIDLSGTMVWQPMPAPMPVPSVQDQKAGIPGAILFASGGSYLGPVVDDTGTIINIKPLGGTVGPGTAVLYPSGRPATQWAVFQTNWDGGGSIWDGGATTWEYMQELDLPVQYVTFQTYWDGGISSWDGGATFWDWDTGVPVPTPIKPPMVQTEWYYSDLQSESLVSRLVGRVTFDLRDMGGGAVDYWQVAT
jgi:hypothetical protein